jgi:formamidopyrimidine-DNA glycosylase
MPELPEVETTRKGLSPHIVGEQCLKLIVRNPNLRWPVPSDLAKTIEGRSLESLERRGKYLVFGFATISANTQQGATNKGPDETFYCLLHLGMSGSVKIVEPNEPVLKHDHIDLMFANNKIMRFNDPRRFGLFLGAGSKPLEHKLLAKIGPEPLSDNFDVDYLFKASRKRSIAIKQFIMDAKVVVGVGNIYANEALFMAGIRPTKSAMTVTKASYHQLVTAIKQVLAKAIAEGGTSLKNFTGADGKPGYFKQALNVYGRAGKPCVNCLQPLLETRMNNRATVYCRLCQK